MKNLKFSALILSILILVAGSLRADSFTFTGTAGTGDDENFFFLSGTSFNVYSAAPHGAAGTLWQCNQGAVCQFPSQGIGVWESPPSQPGEFSGGTVNGVVAQTLIGGGITFSDSSFVLSSDPNNPGGGPVSFTGEIIGAVYGPAGCETLPSSPPCTPIQVFHLHLKGTGTVAVFGEVAGDNGLFDINFAGYTLTGTATVVPEPATWLMFAAGIPGVLGLRHWRLRNGSRTR
jgi:hypothetical protein